MWVAQKRIPGTKKWENIVGATVNRDAFEQKLFAALAIQEHEHIRLTPKYNRHGMWYISAVSGNETDPRIEPRIQVIDY